ncbi:MAG TPA: DUF4252 domain-containing protein [Candidatus Acidoferrales bacterium]|nr:DUF4252 domain-containing protein [Candidatus Acidoferrales bacterium]
MKRIATIAALLLATQLTAFAQDWDPGGTLKKLAARASKTVDVTLDQSMLQFAGGFLDPKDPDQARAKKIIADMKGIYVHSFEFEKSGEYTDQDVAMIQDQLKGPEWSRIVNVKSKSEGQNVQVYFKKEGEKFKGLVVIATEPTELTFVDLVGPITPEDLRALGGQFGIPKVVISHDAGKKGENR